MQKDSNTASKEYRLIQLQIERLQQENKMLKLRAQGVSVLGKVLQESHKENSNLKQEVLELKTQLEHGGVSPLHSLSLPQQPDPATHDQQKSTSMPQVQTATEQTARCYLSKPGDKSFHSLQESFGSNTFEYVNLPKPDHELKLEYSMTSLALGADLHIKELKSKFGTLKEELDELIQQVAAALEQAKKFSGQTEDAEHIMMLARLLGRLEKQGKEATTRESHLLGLATEEEQLKEKFHAIETEQLSQEKVITALRKQMEEEKQEFERVREEVRFMDEVVMVKKEDIPSTRSLTSSSFTSASSESSKKAPGLQYQELHLQGHAQAGTSKSCNCDAEYKRQLEHLQEQLEQVRNERNEAIRLKEEIVDVNHAWDVQYRKLEVETNNQIGDLKKQLEILKSGDQQKRFDTLWVKAKSMMDEETKHKENAIKRSKEFEERSHYFESQCSTLAKELEQRNNTIIMLEAKLREPATSPSGWTDTQSFWDQVGQQQKFPSALPSAPLTERVEPQVSQEESLPPASFTQGTPADIINEIEVLKQQLRVYADDFTSERQDRERVQAEKEKISEQLKAVKEQVLALEEQLRIYEEDFRRERQEKERLQRQLQLSPGARAMYVTQREDDESVSRKAQAVAERQARLRNLREQYDMEERRLMQQEQELQQASQARQPYESTYPPYGRDKRRPYVPQWRQQPLRARGISEIFRGAEVIPDTGVGEEVVDSAGSQPKSPPSSPLSCPRCLKKFPKGDHSGLNAHVDKCID
ncbi:predicted protein [Nematostella vectensis]|uniref:NF-kappa-B essential modulator NEMO CC2-LZ domain-containing protein n=1 Tax=Nematostella vectensis TaxID=45351 RepID=A7T0M5_NEMVE|nr:predicted protein [Nematostella vectensis]|eukprot:XP_001622595.1 predicted protein [Nematostella vectensis]